MKIRHKGLHALAGVPLLFSLVACSTTKVADREPAQERRERGTGDQQSDDDRRDRGGQPSGQGGQQGDRGGQPGGQGGPQADRRDDDRRDGDRRDDGRRGGDWRDDDRRVGDRRDDDRRGGDWRGRRDGRGRREFRRRADQRRCLRCFDRSRYTDVSPFSGLLYLWNDQRRGAGSAETYVGRVCNIRSISFEVLDNEARIDSLEVRHAQTGMWETVQIRANWDFRMETEEDEPSMWFDVGRSRGFDTSCIDSIRVRGFTYKDIYGDFDTAKVQVYYSTTFRGVELGRPGPGPLPGRIDTRVIELDADLQCINDVRSVRHHDDMASDAFLSGGSGALSRCYARPNVDRRLRRVREEGYQCTEDITAIRTPDPACVAVIRSKVGGGTETRGHRGWYNKACSRQVWTCTKTIY